MRYGCTIRQSSLDTPKQQIWSKKKMFHNSFHFTVTSWLKFSYNVGFNPFNSSAWNVSGLLPRGMFGRENWGRSNIKFRNKKWPSRIHPFLFMFIDKYEWDYNFHDAFKNNLITFHQSNSKSTTLMAPSCNGESIVETMVSYLLTERVAKLRSRLQLTLILPRH